MKDVKVIIWDFDGVIIFSDEVREKGFKIIFQDYPSELVNQLLEFHRKNGGLSRYVKIKFFYENILGQSIDQESIQKLADQFSSVMLEELTNPELLNVQWLNVMTKISSVYEHHIASGSDEKELNFLCHALGIHHFFKSIKGSPTPKQELVRKIIDGSGIDSNVFVLIGDAINDYEAALNNNIHFIGYRNEVLAKHQHYLTDLSLLNTLL